MSEPYLVKSGIEEILPMVRGGTPVNHVSFVVSDLCIRMGHLQPQGGGDVSPGRQTYWELGTSFEEGIVLGLTAMGRVSRVMQSDPERYVRPGELELDGIHGNPDLLDLLESRVIEIKLTKISSRHDPQSEKFWKYWAQAKCYARMIGWTSVDLHVGHINADYSGGIDPHYNVWRWDFTQQELDDHWRVIRNHAERLQLQAASAAGTAYRRRGNVVRARA